MGAIPGLLNWIDQQKQAIGAKFGLLADNPREYFRQIEESARDINRQDKLAAQGGKAQLQGLLPSPEQQAAIQARDQRLEGLAMGFAGSIKPVKGGLLGTPAERAAEQGYIDFYHGTGRLDRLLQGKAFDPKRATSGPMPFGTTERSLASNYATGKTDTSLAAADTGELKNYFQVSPKDVGLRGKNPIAAEDAYWSLPAEKRAEIADKARRIGFENPSEGSGKWVVHPDSRGMPFSESHWDYTLKREAGGNPLKALRQTYAESGLLDPYAPIELADLYRLAGFDAPISQINAPWTEAKGVFVGKARITNPLYTDNFDDLATKVVPHLKQQFANDRSRKLAYGADPWDKRVRFTPKEWVGELEQDIAAGRNSHVWTSIPDKVTKELKALGYNGIIDKSGKGGGATHPVVIPFDPGQIRSRFAQFDPARIGEPDLLAAGIPLGLIAGTEVEIPKKPKKKK